MELYRVIRQTARKALRGCWITSFVSALIIFGAYLAVTLTETAVIFALFGYEALTENFFYNSVPSVEELAVAGGTCLLFFLILPVLVLGYSKLHLSFASGDETSLTVLFDYFSSFRKYFRALWFLLVLGVKTILAYAVASLPGTALIWFSETGFTATTRSLQIIKISLVCLGIALILVCFVLARIFTLRWFVSPYYLAEGKSVHEAFKLSVSATKRRCGEIFLFRLSYIGWALILLFVLPIVWALPYFSVSSAIYAKYLAERKEQLDYEAKKAEAEKNEI